MGQMTDTELINAVAEKVMGWELRQDGQNWAWFTGKQHDRGDGQLIPERLYVVEYDPINDPRHWMMVVERMRELGWTHFILEYPTEEGEMAYYCQFDKPEVWQRNNWAVDMDAGRAICKAAKGAVENE